MGDEPVTKQDLASFNDFVVSQLALHKSVISSEAQKSQEVASAALSASNSLKEQSEIKFNHTGNVTKLHVITATATINKNSMTNASKMKFCKINTKI